MKTYRGLEGDERIWYEKSEIEEITYDELRKAGRLPTSDSPSVDLDLLVQKHLRCRLDVNATLPDDVLGQTDFEKDGLTIVSINKNLTGEMEDLGAPGTVGRWRATLAHEAGHVILHKHLFYLDSRQGNFFEEPGSRPKLMRCLKRDVTIVRSPSDWREVQANQGMAAILMPKPFVIGLVNEKKREIGLASAPVITGSSEASVLAAYVSDLMEVSRQAAAIRLATLGLSRDGAFRGFGSSS